MAHECTVASDIEAALIRAWNDASKRAFEVEVDDASTHVDRLEARAEEAEAYSRYLRFKIAVLRVQELKEGTSHES